MTNATAASKPVLTFTPSSLLARITSGKSSRDYRRHEGVFAQGDSGDAVFYLQSGKVKLAVVSSRGKEAVIGILGRGTFFGEGCLAGQPLRMSSASALEPSTLVRVAKPTMIGLLHGEPEFAALFTAYLLTRSVRIEEDLIDQLFNSSEKRLARVLLRLARFGKMSEPEAVIPKMTQDTLASMVGTTRSRVSYFMNRFREMGFIDYGRGALKVRSGLLTVVLRD